MTSVSPVTSTRFPHPSLALAGLLCIAGVASTARAATLGVQAAGGAPGAPVEVQVFLTGGNGQVAGVQVDIVGDPTCLAPVQGSGTKAECSSNPAIPKDLSTSIRPGPSVRALLLSMSDTEPIKQDTWLFTCVFNIDAATTAAQCPVNLVGAILSDSQGHKLPVTTTDGMVQIHQAPAPGGTAVSGGPAAGSTPGVAGAAIPAAGGQTASEGCAIAAPRAGGGTLPWLLLLPALVHRRRRRSTVASHPVVRTDALPAPSTNTITNTYHDLLL